MDEDTGYLMSPIGIVEIKANQGALVSVRFVSGQIPEKKIDNFESEIIQITKIQLKEYFEKKIEKFNIPMLVNGTKFQEGVWKEVQKIEYGCTKTYSDIAKSLGSVEKIRAVGNANGQNKLLVIIPCHRVIGSDGSLIGYAGELWRKQWLLEHESKTKQLFLIFK
jgi:methylated-DNA-[protein]-cysteine S-methyltransferase